MERERQGSSSNEVLLSKEQPGRQASPVSGEGVVTAAGSNAVLSVGSNAALLGALVEFAQTGLDAPDDALRKVWCTRE